MQQLKTAVAVFCIACVCAELVGQLLGDAWGRQCIKAAAGLYILVAFFHALPEIQAGILPFEVPDLPAASFGSAEDAILLQAQSNLSARLEEQITRETGLSVSVDVTLEESQSGVQAVEVQLSPSSETSEQQRSTVENLLCKALYLDINFIHWTGQAEGG